MLRIELCLDRMFKHRTNDHIYIYVHFYLLTRDGQHLHIYIYIHSDPLAHHRRDHPKPAPGGVGRNVYFVYFFSIGKASSASQHSENGSNYQYVFFLDECRHDFFRIHKTTLCPLYDVVVVVE